MKKTNLNIGCGHRLKKGFINVDIIPEKEIDSPHPYVYGDVRKLPFEDNYADYVEMYTVIEHLPFRDVEPALKEIHRVMKDGAKLVIVTDDFDGIALDWIRMRMLPFNLERYQDVMETVYGSQRWTGDEHRSPMTTDFLNWALVKAGFTKGEFIKYPKGTPVPKVGTEPAKPEMAFRTGMIVAEVTK
jgi:predicted SAM-dependent methyltransferase